MRMKSDEDLFQESTMTFGEHLEELRSRLFKALFGLIAGFLFGLFFAPWVVEFIQGPIENALTNYYMDAAEKQVKNVEKSRTRGDSQWPPPRLDP